MSDLEAVDRKHGMDYYVFIHQDLECRPNISDLWMGSEDYLQALEGDSGRTNELVRLGNKLE